MIDVNSHGMFSASLGASIQAQAFTKMNHSEIEYAKYWLSNQSETFAEAYKASFGGKGFGLSPERTKEVFGSIISKFHEMFR